MKIPSRHEPVVTEMRVEQDYLCPIHGSRFYWHPPGTFGKAAWWDDRNDVTHRSAPIWSVFHDPQFTLRSRGPRFAAQTPPCNLMSPCLVVVAICRGIIASGKALISAGTQAAIALVETIDMHLGLPSGFGFFENLAVLFAVSGKFGLHAL
jgi:hypothetical protein